MDFITAKKEKKTFRDLALTHLSKILELSCDEFKGGYWIKQIKGDYTEEIYIPDSRKRIIQAIEFFALILQPFFDKDTKDKHSELKKKIEDNLKKFDGKKIDREEFIIKKLNLMKELFESLNFLLKEKDYLKGEIYQEVQGEWDEEADEK